MRSLIALVFVTSLGCLSAQAPHQHEVPESRQPSIQSTPPAPLPVPINDLATAWVEAVQAVDQFTAGECLEKSRAKQRGEFRGRMQRRIEARLPGYTVNWDAYEIVKKK